MYRFMMNVIFEEFSLVSASGLIAYYQMNAGRGTTAVNYSTNTGGIDGTLTNGPTWISSPIQFARNSLSFVQCLSSAMETKSFDQAIKAVVQ